MRPITACEILKTCTPYLAGNVPAKGEHCAWMESSAVVYCNSVLGARTNTEGRESTSAAMLTGKIPDWGLHRTEQRLRHASHRRRAARSRASWTGACSATSSATWCRSAFPVLVGVDSQPDLVRHKHFGAAAASSGGVEMYHIVGVTPEAETLEMAFGAARPVETFDLRRRRNGGGPTSS